MWVTQHHKSVYAHALLDDLLDELAAVADEPPVTTDAILAEGVDDNTIMERLRVAARDHPDSTLAALYDRFRGRRFPETCWKHRIAYADRVDATASTTSATGSQPTPTASNAGSPTNSASPSTRCGSTNSPTCRVRATGTEGHPHRVRRHHALGRRLGLYGDRAFDSPIPFVFVPYGVEPRDRVARGVVPRGSAPDFGVSRSRVRRSRRPADRAVPAFNLWPHSPPSP